jgi:UDP-2-acetamido-3-amino-2,3-dideoxy-glucuronate N-acetyltransferase
MSVRPPFPRVGLVGLGRWGRNYLSALPGSVVAGCDPSPEARSRAGELRPSLRVFDDLDALLASDVDAVVVATPSARHAEHAARALRARKHVLVEKPMALDVGDAERLVSEARSRGLLLAVGHLLLHHPSVAKVLSLVRAGAVGDVVRVRSTRTSSGSRFSTDDALWSLGPHDVAFAASLFGVAPREVEARRLHAPGEPAGAISLRLAIPGGAEFEANMSRSSAARARSTTIVGTRAVATFDEIDGSITIERRGAPALSFPPLEGVAPLTEQCASFVARIRDGRVATDEADLGVAVVRTLVAAERSLSACAPVPTGAPRAEGAAIRA